MVILLTGCCGYIGSVLTKALLDDGHIIIGVDNLMYKQENVLLGLLEHPNFDFHKLDLTDPNDMEYVTKQLLPQCDAIIPLAALVGAPICEKNAVAAFAINDVAISYLVHNMKPHQHLIYLNSNSAYGETAENVICDETSPVNPISVYATSKLRGEEWALYHENTTVLRLATVFGLSPRMRFDLMLNDFTAKLVHNKTLEIFEGHFRRNFVHVKDVARGVKHILDTGLEGVFNFGNPFLNQTKKELALNIARKLKLPDGVIIDGEGRDPDRRNYEIDNGKILRTGFHFQYHDWAIYKVIKFCELLPLETLKGMGNYANS